MTNATLLATLRRRLQDVDAVTQLYADSLLWGYVADRLITFQVRKVRGMAGLVCSGTGFAADVQDDVGVMLALGAAALLLHDKYNDKVSRGEFGVSWKSGMESESTVDAMRAYKAAITQLEREIDELTLIRASTTSAARVQ